MRLTTIAYAALYGSIILGRSDESTPARRARERVRTYESQSVALAVRGCMHHGRIKQIITFTCVAGVHYDMPPPSRRAVCIGSTCIIVIRV